MGLTFYASPHDFRENVVKIVKYLTAAIKYGGSRFLEGAVYSVAQHISTY
jgi:hypothetical protein